MISYFHDLSKSVILICAGERMGNDKKNNAETNFRKSVVFTEGRLLLGRFFPLVELIADF